MAKQPKNPFHPGEILLEEFLDPLGMSQAAFAEKIGWTKARLNQLIRGKRGVTAEAALDLAEILGTSPKLWMNFQVTYDLDRAKGSGLRTCKPRHQRTGGAGSLLRTRLRFPAWLRLDSLSRQPLPSAHSPSPPTTASSRATVLR